MPWRWPWTQEKREERAEAGGYTDSRISAAVSAATGSGSRPQDAARTAVVEIAANMVARALSSGSLAPETGMTRLVTPELLALAGRELVVRGEQIFVIDGRELLPVSTHDLYGGARKSSWRYRCDLVGPSTHETVTLGASEVLHFRWNVSAALPFYGISPVGAASLTSGLVGGLEKNLGNEAAATSGYVLPIPQTDDGQEGADDEEDPAIAQLRQDLAGLKGRTTMVETTSNAWGEGRAGAPQSDWMPRRIGANPPPSLIALRENAAGYLLAAAGISPALIAPGDGAGQREAYRRFLFSCIVPLGVLIAREIADKMAVPGCQFDFSALGASDIASRARAFQSMTGAGMAPEKAAALAGLMVSDDA